MSKFTDKLIAKGILVNDPTKQIPMDGLWSQLNTTGNTYTNTTGPYNDPYMDPMLTIESRIRKLETDNKFLRLKILSMEGKFTQEEVINIRKMLVSEDESSRTLAESIIENA